MANERNLIPQSERSPSEAREMGKKGGIASGRTRRLKKALREFLRDDLERIALDEKGAPLLDREGQEYSQGMAMARQYLVNVQRKLKAGETRQFEAMVELVEGKNVNLGGNPDGEPLKVEQSVNLTGIPLEKLKAAKALLYGDGSGNPE